MVLEKISGDGGMIYGYLQTANEADLRSQQTAIESYAQNRNLQIGGWLAAKGNCPKAA